MKSNVSFIHVSIFAMVMVLFSCNVKKLSPDTDAEKQLIEKSIRASIGWAANKDLGLLYSVISNDSSFLEVHPGSKIVRGFAEFRKSEEFWMNPDFKAIRYKIWDLDINISRSGDVAWWFCMLDDINEWKGEPANWENTRWTGVLEKRNGTWIIVQQHFSFAKE
jgi:ketosteroid isomerase-like protein